MRNKTLNNFGKNIFSQFGEDGIIGEILKRLEISSGTCVEFGAWDGVLFSNTANLWGFDNKWRGVLIEADSEKFKTLTKVTKDKNVVAINTFVQPVGNDSLEEILKREEIDFSSIKLLSIDIDGNEFHILSNLKKLHPEIVITEYNPTIPKELELVSKENTFFGSSARAICNLMKDMGYSILSITKSNCIFVDSKFVDKFGDLNTTFEDIFDSSGLTYVITGYDGKYAFSGQPAYSMSLPLKKDSIESGQLFFFEHSQVKIRWNYLKDNIKNLGKLIIGANNIMGVKTYINYIFWKFKGKPIPAHGLYKSKVLKRIGKKYALDVFVETGTAGGTMIREMSNYFSKLYTIELSPTLYFQSKAFASDEKNIEFILGDSGTMINEVLKKLQSPALFWLDAHYSGSGTARGSIDTPILKELYAIFNHVIKNHVIVIDDIRDFDGTNDYPEINSMINEIKKKYPRLNFARNNDLLIISNRELEN